jgi:hypothetical protein
LNMKIIAGAALIAAVAATGAAAQAFVKYGDVEGWNVFVDNENRSCLIERVDDNGNVVQMGLTKDHSIGYVGVFTKADIGIKKGAQEEIYIDIDGALYSSTSTGMKGNITKGYSGGYIRSNNPQFIDDLARKYVMTVFPKTANAFRVYLKGTYKAMEMARKCNAEQG